MDASPFASLAPELRNRIYVLVFTSSLPVDIRAGDHALTLTCNQIRAESLALSCYLPTCYAAVIGTHNGDVCEHNIKRKRKQGQLTNITHLTIYFEVYYAYTQRIVDQNIDVYSIYAIKQNWQKLIVTLVYEMGIEPGQISWKLHRLNLETKNGYASDWEQDENDTSPGRHISFFYDLSSEVMKFRTKPLLLASLKGMFADATEARRQRVNMST